MELQSTWQGDILVAMEVTGKATSVHLGQGPFAAVFAYLPDMSILQHVKIGLFSDLGSWENLG